MSHPYATISPSLQLTESNSMEKKISSLEVVIDGVSFFYEAHSHHRVAEILSSSLEALKWGEPNEYGVPTRTIDSFTVHYFKEAN